MTAPEPATDIPRLYTVGHSNHELPAFIDLLRRHGITAIADVRSSPYSQYNSQFNRDVLTSALKASQIEYIFVGDQLGARRSEPECYEEGRVSFALAAKTPSFQAGLVRLKEGLSKYRVAIMCAEKDPLVCHRMMLVCRSLRGQGISILHILEDDLLESNEAAEDRLLRVVRLDEGSLFETREQLLDRAYDIQGKRIAYAKDRECTVGELQG